MYWFAIDTFLCGNNFYQTQMLPCPTFFILTSYLPDNINSSSWTIFNVISYLIL